MHDLGLDAYDSPDTAADGTAPVWGVFGDLMAGLVGAFVLLLVAVLGVQVELARDLDAQAQRRRALEQALEHALAAPLAEGRVTLTDGRIGISGSVLFALNSDRLQPDGRALLQRLAGPLGAYLQGRRELLMVSGFTDDQPVLPGNRRFDDNLELSAQRALTVTRALVAAGLPPQTVFAAAFGPQQPVASNGDELGRARNRRVELAPVPQARRDGAEAAPEAGPSALPHRP